MNFIFRISICLLILTCAFLNKTSGQIYSRTADYTDKTTFVLIGSKLKHQDSIYVFKEPGTVSLSAKDPNGGKANFVWSKLYLDNLNNKVKSIIQTDTARDSSVLKSIGTGGYVVQIKNASSGAYTNYTAWVLVDTFLFGISNKKNGEVIFSDSYCDRMFIRIKACELVYFDSTVSIAPKPYHNLTRYTITANPGGIEASFPQGAETFSIDQKIQPPPSDDTEFTITAKDLRFKERDEKTDVVKYTAIRPKPVFSVISDSSFNKRGKEGSAPIKVKIDFKDSKTYSDLIFTMGNNDSIFIHKNTDATYEYEFHGISKTLIAPEFTDYYYRVPKNLEKPDEPYTLKLKAINAKYKCDVSDSTTLLVKPPEVKIPNVFTPGGDPSISKFLITNTSIDMASIQIFSRWGKIVHQFEGPFRDWPGWDGTILTSGHEASAGPYYLLLRAYPDAPIKDGNKKNGSYYYTKCIYLIRPNGY